MVKSIRADLPHFLFYVPVQEVNTETVLHEPSEVFFPLVSMHTYNTDAPEVRIFLPLFYRHVPYLFQEGHPHR